MVSVISVQPAIAPMAVAVMPMSVAPVRNVVRAARAKMPQMPVTMLIARIIKLVFPVHAKSRPERVVRRPMSAVPAIAPMISVVHRNSAPIVCLVMSLMTRVSVPRLQTGLPGPGFALMMVRVVLPAVSPVVWR